MAKKKKVEEKVEYSERELRLASLRNNKIPPAYLLGLVMDYKAKKLLCKDFPMPKELAETLLIIIEKMIGSNSWRGYTPDWKEEFRGRAIEHLLRYAHNFSPQKCKEGKGNDAYNYFAMITMRAFVQSLKKCRQYTENNIHINHDVIYQENAWNSEQELKVEGDISVNPESDNLDYGSVNY